MFLAATEQVRIFCSFSAVLNLRNVKSRLETFYE